MSFTDKNIGFIGAGAMAEALIKSILRSGADVAKIFASDINPERGQYLTEKYGITFMQSNINIVKSADVVIYAVKPYMMDSVLTEISSNANRQQVHISIAAGITLDFITKYLNENIAIVRVMPNTPCLIGEGASAYATGVAVTSEQETIVKEILNSAGVAVKVPENLLNAVTGLSGSGPAYVFLFIEALADAGVMAGLPRNVANTLATQTLLGAAKMVKETRDHPARLKDMVTTPGGTTIAGLHVLEQGKIRATLIDAVLAATKRSEELGRVK